MASDLHARWRGADLLPGRIGRRALGAVLLVVALLVVAPATANAATVSKDRKTITVETSSTPTAFETVSVPSGADRVRVIVGASALTSGTLLGNQLRMTWSCQLTGGGSTGDQESQRTWGFTGSFFYNSSTGDELDVTGCTSFTFKRRNFHVAGTPGTGTATVSVMFYGSGIPDLATTSWADSFDEAKGDPDPYMFKAGDPVQTLTGNFVYSRADVTIPGRGPTPGFIRSYNSAYGHDSVLGRGWTHNYTARIATPSGDTTGALLLLGPSGRQDRYGYDGFSGLYTAPPGSTTRLTRNLDLTFTATHKDNSAWTFDSGGKLTGIRDRHGNLSSLAYDGSGRLSTISDPAGRGVLTLTYDANGRLWKVTDWLTTARVVEYGYDTNTPSRLKTVTDREGNVTTYGYDGTSQRLTTITDDNGRVALTLTYDTSGRVSTQKDAKGLTTGQGWSFSYVTNGDGTKTTTVTNPATSHEPSWNPTVADTYDTSGRIVKRVAKPTGSSAEDVVTEYTYDADGNLATAKDGRGFTTAFCYDVGTNGAGVIGSWRNLTRRIDPAPTSGGNVLVTLISYDVHDNPVRTIPPKGVTTTSTTGCTTDLSSALDLDYATTMTYDADGVKLLSTSRQSTDPDTGATVTAKTTFEYDGAQPGLVSYVTPPRGNTGSSPDHAYATHFAYYGASDPASKRGMLKSVTDPLGNATTFDYDAVGRRISMVDPLGNTSGGTPGQHTWEYQYDNEDRLRFARAPAPSGSGGQLVTESRYDGVGNLVALIDANGQVTKYQYDVRDSLQEVWESPSTWTDPDSTPSPKYVTAYQYDHTGNLTRVTRASGDGSYERATEYAYDGLNRVRSETQYPSWPSTSGALVMTTTYDLNSNRATVVDQLSRTTTYAYDRLNRLVGIDFSDAGTPDVAYTYDANGNRATMVDGTGTSSYSYDELNRLLSVTTPASPSNKTVGYRYDRDGNRVKLLYPGGDAVTYAFDNASRMTGLTDWASRATGYAYYPDGALASQTNPNGTVATYAYDNARRLTEVWNRTSTSATDAISRHQFAMDAVGNRTEVAETLAPVASGGATTPPGGLPTGHTLTPGTAPTDLPTGHTLAPGTAPSGLPTRPGPSATSQTLTYAYDRLYRLTSAAGGPLGATSYTYDPVGNRLSRTRGGASTSYAYDRADRISSAGATSYAVDAVGNTTARGSDTLAYDQANRLTQTVVGSVTASYAYDGDGKRISKTVSSTTTSYVYDVNRGLPVLLEDGARRYVWGLGLAYEVEGSAALVYHVDGLGSVRALTDGSKVVVQTYESDEFGVPIAASGGSSQPFGYTGEQRDPENGLVYLRARYYDALSGRLVSRDEYGGVLGRPCSLNRFTYTINNPATYTDPSGWKPRALNQLPSGIRPVDEIVCRGTSDDGWENPTLIAMGMTPTSSDPIVATLFGLRSQEYGSGQGEVQCATPLDLSGLMQGNPGSLGAYESEVAIHTTPGGFASRASVRMTAQQARSLISRLFGVELPSRIGNNADLSYYIHNTPRLTQMDMSIFYRTAFELYGSR